MQIQIEIQEETPETVVTIRCRERTAYIDKLVAALKMTDRQIVVTQGGAAMSLRLEAILYIESVDGKCFLYTADGVYESSLKLYELERQLEPYLFVRIHKSGIVNLKNIGSIRAYIDRRLLLTMSNGEQLIVSRRYAEEIKGLLGVK